MQMGEFLWELQTSAWIYDDNNAGRWHCNHVSSLCVQKNGFTDSSYSNTPSDLRGSLKDT